MDLESFRHLSIPALFTRFVLCIYIHSPLCFASTPLVDYQTRVNTSGHPFSIFFLVLVYRFGAFYSTFDFLAFDNPHPFTLFNLNDYTTMYEEMGSMTDDIPRRCSLP